MIGPTRPGDRGLLDAFESRFIELEGAIVYSKRYNPGRAELTDMVTAVGRMGADAIVLDGFVSSGITGIVYNKSTVGPG